ncbi:MAG: hypothetical protein EOO15_11060 [Chitinophagaceae bacterium]|nr:MAG: hypothetical protein EOO15_11060 [Chitinophagaceae bacterium]
MDENTLGTGSTGNASNPNPRSGDEAPSQSKSLLGDKAETYLREGGSIEDMPDARQEEDAEKQMRPGGDGAQGQ